MGKLIKNLWSAIIFLAVFLFQFGPLGLQAQEIPSQKDISDQDEVRKEDEPEQEKDPFLLRIFSGFSFRPGGGARVTNLYIQFMGLDAEMTDDPGELFFSLNLSSSDFMIWRKLGIGVFYEISNFKLNKQIATTGGTESGDYKPKKLGTFVSGRFSYLVPTLFWKFSRNEEFAMKLGWGLGNGSANFSGNAIFGVQRNIGKVAKRFSFSTSKKNVRNYLVFVDFKISNLNLGIRVGGPSFSDQGFSYEMDTFIAYVTYVLTL